jgi:hypothetical protein
MTTSTPTDATSDERSIDAVPPSSAPSISQPPPLPEQATRFDRTRAAADRAFAECMLERLAASDYAGTLTAAEALLVQHPLHHDALECAAIARSELRKLYLARLGSPDSVPYIVVGLQGLLALDFRAGFLLSRIDKRASFAEIVEAGGLPELDALRILSELYLQRIIGVAGALHS